MAARAARTAKAAIPAKAAKAVMAATAAMAAKDAMAAKALRHFKNATLHPRDTIIYTKWAQGIYLLQSIIVGATHSFDPNSCKLLQHCFK